MSTQAFQSPPSQDAAVSSGPSPTPRTLHLIGAGKVGRAFLRQLAQSDLPVRLVAVSDRSATAFAPAGLDGAALAGWKDSGRPFAAHPRAAGIALDVALAVANAEIVVDCSTSDLAPAARAAAARRTRFLLDQGRHVVLAAKTPLFARLRDQISHGLHRGPRVVHEQGRKSFTVPRDLDWDLFAPGRRDRLHVNAVFGGTGAALLDDLDELRRECRTITCVPNATTSAVLDRRAAGATLADAIAHAQERGLTEKQPLQDLDGRDAALKLALIEQIVFGDERPLEQVVRPPLREVALHRPRPSGLVRLVGRIERGGASRLAVEAVAAASRLAVSSGQVVYCYELADGRARVHVGDGVGSEGTASALLADLRRALALATAAARRAA